MVIKQVFLIYVPYLNEKLYYVCNSEWTFEVEQSRFFVSLDDAQMAIDRLRTVDIRDLNLHSINPEQLTIEGYRQEVEEFIQISI